MITTERYLPELECARSAAAEAAAYLRTAYAAFTAVPDAPVDISTEADRRSQDLIIESLMRKFPDDGFCAEEATPLLSRVRRDGRRLWVIDPIDGTRGFALKNGEFSVMVGLLVDDDVVVGVVTEPAIDRETFAVRGGGCRVSRNGGPAVAVTVSANDQLARSTMVRSHLSVGRRSPEAERLQPAKIVETYSAGVKLAMVARGEVDFYLNTYSKFFDWDICAGHLLVTEAGGSMTELTGGPIRYRRERHAQHGGLIAGNGRFHADIIDRVNRTE